MRTRRALLLLLTIGLIVTLGPAAWSQQVPRATCLDCHEAEGMEFAVLRTTPYIEIPTGEPLDLDVIVVNPWLHEITSGLVTLNLSQAPGLTFEKPDDIQEEDEFTLSIDESRNVTFPVEAGATAIVATMEQTPDESGQGANDVDTRLWLPDGSANPASPDGIRPPELQEGELEPTIEPARTVERIVIEDQRLAETGDWNFEAFRETGPPEDPINMRVQVFYNTTDTLSQSFRETIDPENSGTVTFPVQGQEQGDVTVQYSVELTAYYDHGDITAQDEGNETLEGSSSFTIGDQLETEDVDPTIPEQAPVNWPMNARAWGEVTGFIGLFLVPLSLVLGGAFGRRNVLWVNKLVESARVRVLWHNAVSFILLFLTILHLVLFIYEPAFEWSVGMIWGGVSTLALIGLGVTGGFQRGIARSIDYAKWRLLHIAMAVVFVATLLVHSIVDGVHFDWARAWLGFT